MANEVLKTEEIVQIAPLKEEASAAPKTVIEIGAIQALFAVLATVLAIGIAWGSLKTLVRGIKKVLDDEIKPGLKDIRERFGTVEDRVETLWQDKFAPSHSPRQLNERGNDILNQSGIKQIIESKKQKLLDAIKEKKPTNAYDAEQAVLSIVAEMPKHCPEVIDELKNGAFKVGQNIDTVLFVGGIYFRNVIFEELGFSLTDLDKPKVS